MEPRKYHAGQAAVINAVSSAVEKHKKSAPPEVVQQLVDALGMCLTALSFELENAVRRKDIVAGLQIADAMKAARAAITATK